MLFGQEKHWTRIIATWLIVATAITNSGMFTFAGSVSSIVQDVSSHEEETKNYYQEMIKEPQEVKYTEFDTGYVEENEDGEKVFGEGKESEVAESSTAENISEESSQEISDDEDEKDVEVESELSPDTQKPELTTSVKETNEYGDEEGRSGKYKEEPEGDESEVEKIEDEEDENSGEEDTTEFLYSDEEEKAEKEVEEENESDDDQTSEEETTLEIKEEESESDDQTLEEETVETTLEITETEETTEEETQETTVEIITDLTCPSRTSITILIITGT